MILTIDSFAWIEFLSGGPHGIAVRRQIEEAGFLLTPDVVLAEVARKFARDGLTQEEIRSDLRSVSTMSEIVGISPEVALGCFGADADLRAHAMRLGLNRPGLADAVVLSVARTHSARVLTGDPHFRSLADTVWVGG